MVRIKLIQSSPSFFFSVPFLHKLPNNDKDNDNNNLIIIITTVIE